MNDRRQKELDRATRALLNMSSISDMREPFKIPTKADLERKFVMWFDSNGKPSIVEK